jgi:hypothetical protein
MMGKFSSLTGNTGTTACYFWKEFRHNHQSSELQFSCPTHESIYYHLAVG